MVYMSQTNLTMKYPKITTLSILFYCFGLTAGCIVAYFDTQYTRDLDKYDILCFGVLITGALGLIAPFVRVSYSNPTQAKRAVTRLIAIAIGLVHFYFLKKMCTSSHPDNSYLAMRFFYFFVAWYLLTIFAPISKQQKNVLV
jgi:hypothetical protein